jgi:hypothetical protein
MERRIREWVVGRNDSGRAVLEWKEESLHAELTDDDAAATWADLDVSALSLEDESKRRNAGFNPYDHRPAPTHERKRKSTC